MFRVVCPPGPFGSAVSSCFCVSLGPRGPFGIVSSGVFVCWGPRGPLGFGSSRLFHVVGPSGLVWVCFLLFLHVFGPSGSVWVCFLLLFRVFGPSGFVWVCFLLIVHAVGPRSPLGFVSVCLSEKCHFPARTHIHGFPQASYTRGMGTHTHVVTPERPGAVRPRPRHDGLQHTQTRTDTHADPDFIPDPFRP